MVSMTMSRRTWNRIKKFVQIYATRHTLVGCIAVLQLILVVVVGLFCYSSGANATIFVMKYEVCAGLIVSGRRS